MNNPLWLMTSAFSKLNLPDIIDHAKTIGVQGLEVLVFRRDGARQDHVATHLNYETFGVDEAMATLELFNKAGLKFSLGAYENLLGGPEEERLKNQNHLLLLIRMAALLGGDDNGISVGTFTGYNHELGMQDGGFEKNLLEYKKVFTPIINYAEDLGVTVTYENCPMEGWCPSTFPVTYNNLPATLAARKLMYTLIPSPAHGEIYDPSHDVWQLIDPSDVIAASEMSRIKKVHIKATRLLTGEARTHWGGIYPMQSVNKELSSRANIPICAHDWDRHSYEAMLPGFGGSDSMDWRKFINSLIERNFSGAFVMENEAANSAHTGNLEATIQGFKASRFFLAPMIWPLHEEKGYCYKKTEVSPLITISAKKLPLLTMENLK